LDATGDFSEGSAHNLVGGKKVDHKNERVHDTRQSRRQGSEGGRAGTDAGGKNSQEGKAGVLQIQIGVRCTGTGKVRREEKEETQDHVGKKGESVVKGKKKGVKKIDNHPEQ